MIIITDGQPTAPCPGPGCDPDAAGAAAATAAKAAGTEIFVLGVGVNPTTTTYLKDNIATDASHYFDVTDYASLGTTLTSVPVCPETGTLIVKKQVVGSAANPNTFSFV